MKKLRTILCLTTLSCAFTACTWQIPEKISVKTQAEYEFSIGNVEKDLGIDFSVDSFQDKIAIKDARLYDYYPGKKDDKVQQILMRIPLMEIPIDLNEYFNNSSLAESIDKMSFSQDVTVPSVNFSNEQDINVSDISAAINNGLTIAGPVVSAPLLFNIDFTSVSYLSGTMVITCAEAPDYMTVKIISGGNSCYGQFFGGKASINLQNFTLYKADSFIEFGANIATTYIGKISENSVIRRAEGITYALPEIPLNFDFDTINTTDDSFESCTVKEGFVNTNIVLPSEWAGVTVAYSMSTSGGIAVDEPKTYGNTKVIDLKEKTITPGKTKVKAGIYLTLSNAIYNNSGSPKFVCTSDIKTFSSVTLNLNKVDTKVVKNDKLSDVMLDTVKGIKFGSSGLKGVFENNLPEGNVVTLEAKSKFIGLDKSKNLATGKNQEFEIMSELEQEDILSKNPAADNEYNSWDFSVKLKFPGYTDANPNRVTVKNVVPGTSYHIGFSVEPVINWLEIKIDSSQTHQSDSMPLNMDLQSIVNNLDSTMGDTLFDKLRLSKLPLYMYCTKPDIAAFDNAKFTGKISMSIKDVTTLQEIDEPVVINGAEETINFVDYPKLEFENNTVITDLDKIGYSKFKDIAAILYKSSEENTDIFLDYDVSLINSSQNRSEIIITPDMLSENSAASIGIIAAIVLPLEFEAKEKIEDLSINEMLGMNTEFSTASLSQLNEIQSIVDSAAIVYTVKQLPIYSNPDWDLKLILDEHIRPVSLGTKTGTVQFNTADIKTLCKAETVTPQMILNIRENTKLSITRNPVVSMDVVLKVATDGTYQVFGGK